MRAARKMRRMGAMEDGTNGSDRTNGTDRTSRRQPTRRMRAEGRAGRSPALHWKRAVERIFDSAPGRNAVEPDVLVGLNSIYLQTNPTRTSDFTFDCTLAAKRAVRARF